MKKISAEKYVEGVISIYVEQPKYQTGHDGSDGSCDCIGMCRGALKREGVENVTGMSGTNYAARNTILGLQKIKSVKQLALGDVVLKTRDKDDASLPLPDRYRKGGSDYDAKLGETNFTHIGTVTGVNPLRITHMTSPTAKIDTKLGKWEWFGQLPWVSNDGAEEQDAAEWATVVAESGKTVKMRAKPSTLCSLYWNVPIGSQVVLVERGGTWSEIIWAGQSGYMMTKFLRTGESLYTVTIPGLSAEQADAVIALYQGAYKEMEVG